jgi:transposase
MRQKRPALQQALAGRFGSHQRFMVAHHLTHIDDLDHLIAEVTAEIEERLRPFETAQQLLETIPGVGPRVAQVLLAEVGPDPSSRFPSPGHLASWAGMCPGNHESAGKRLSGTTRKANPWLRRALVEAANAAGRTRNTYLRAQFGRLTARRGRKRAAVAVGHTILIIAYHLLSRGDHYSDLGPAYFDEREQHDVTRRLVRRLEALGHQVTLTPAVA